MIYLSVRFLYCILYQNPESFNIFYSNMERYSFDDGEEYNFEYREGLPIDQQFYKIKKIVRINV